jgi:hypothetical protein
MSYTAVPRWSHGDRVTAADLNILSGDIEFLYAASGGVNLNWGVPFISGSHTYLFAHRFRWFWYRGEGYMELINGLYRTSLSSPDAWATALDTDTLGWLHYGDLYKVAGVSWAMEDNDA